MKKLVFIDLDGVIRKEVDLLYKKEDIELVLQAAQAIQKLNAAGYRVIIVTNQPVVARGFCTLEELYQLNAYTEKLLNDQGATVDKWYVCPHHPHPERKGKLGINGPNQQYVIECTCRKPKPGLLLQAIKDHEITDTSNCWMIGDKTSDIKAAQGAGISNTILVKTGYGGDDGFNDATPKYTANDLYNAVKTYILKNT
ncbi:MAG TPA: HAD family hydrolase [Candidatus Nanoarchaeia archaeon]|nr:HAD family hydrolase [Candidatus Nanoarchaeia archaeon]